MNSKFKKILVMLLSAMMILTSSVSSLAFTSENAVPDDASADIKSEQETPPEESGPSEVKPDSDASAEQEPDTDSKNADADADTDTDTETKEKAEIKVFSDESSDPEPESKDEEPAEEPVVLKGPAKAPSRAGSTDGKAYAVLEDNGDMIFFRSNDTYSNLDTGTFTDILGNTYSGTVFTKFEQTEQISSREGCSWNTHRSNIKTVSVADGQKIEPRNCAYWFLYCENMISCDLSGLDTANVKDMYQMFCHCNSLTSLNLSGFVTTNVENMGYMFYGCSALTSLDLTNFATSNVTSMEHMFGYCFALTGLNISGWDTSSVTNMAYMFTNCKALTSLDLSDFDTENVRDMSSIFHGCIMLTSLDLSGWNTSMVVDMNSMFKDCKALTSLDLSDFDTTSVSYMNGMFDGCKALTSLNIASFDTSNVSVMQEMFCHCDALTSIDVTGFDTSNVTTMASMFADCENLTSLDLTNFDTSSVTKMEYMFSNCNKLTNLDLSAFDASKVIDMSRMFFSCNALTSLDLSAFNTPNVTSMKEMFYRCTSLKSLDIRQFDTSKTTNTSGMFDYCSPMWLALGDKTIFHANLQDQGILSRARTLSGDSVDSPSFDSLTAYDGSAPGWYRNGSGVFAVFDSADGSLTFFSDINSEHYNGEEDGTKTYYENVDYTGTSSPPWNAKKQQIKSVSVKGTISPTSCRSWFDGCWSMTSCNLSGLDTSKVTDMQRMFYRCSSLTSLDLSGFDTSKVTDMKSMFSDCYRLIRLDLSGFDTSKVTDMRALFSNCKMVHIALGPKSIFTQNFDNQVTLHRYKTLSGDSVDSPSFDSLTAYDGSAPGWYRNGSGVFAVFDSADGSLTFFSDINSEHYNGEEDGTKTYYDNIDNTGSNVPPWDAKKQQIKSVSVRGTISPISCHSWFDGCYAITSCDLSGLDTSSVTDMSHMFYNCSNLTNIDVTGFDTSKVTDMDGMFSICRALTSLDISNFDTSKVTDMSALFSGCSKLTDIDISNFDTSKVTDMSGMFSSCSALKELDITRLDTSNVTDMSSMFSSCGVLKNLDVTGLDTSKVTDMSGMFYNCMSLPSVDVSGWDTSSVTNMQTMFYNCRNLMPAGISRLDTSKVTDMSAMFYDCYAMPNIDVSSWDTSKVTDMSNMFEDCTSLTSLDLSEWDTSSVADMARMFDNCNSLTSLDVSGWDTSNVTNMSYMFCRCENLPTLDVSGFDTSKVTDMSNMFKSCRALTGIDVSGFDTSNVTNMSYMFNECHILPSLDVSGFDTSSVTDMSNMFSDCRSIPELDISGFDTSKVTSMENMFLNCIALTGLDLTNFNTSKVIDMDRMFANCKALTDLNLTNFDTSSVISMESIFSGCESLTSLDITSFDTSKVKNMTGMFLSCRALKSLDLTGFDTSSVSDMRYMFLGSDNLAEIKLGSEFSFRGKSITSTNNKALLPGETWLRKSTGEKYASTELRDTYDGSSMADTYYRIIGIAFNGTGGNVEEAYKEGYIGGTLDALPSAERKGYTFAGWFTEIDGGTQFNPGDEITQAEYFAHWTPNVYILILDPNGGTGAVPPIPLTYDQEYTAGEPYTKDGFRFDGWNTRKNGTGDQYDKTDVLSMLTEENGGTVTLYAQWTQENCIVTFDSLGGSEVPPRIVKAGKAVGALYRPVKEGYTFVNWLTDESVGQSISASTIITSDCTFYAYWKKNPVVTFDSNGGSVTETEREVGYNKAIGELPTPKKANYTFDGWYTAPADGKKITSTTRATSDVTYFAHWKIRLNFDPNGGKITKDAQYVPPEAATAVIKMAKTDNVAEDGSSFSGGYGNNKAETKTVTIEGAEKLYVKITYQTESVGYDWVSIYPSGITPSASNYSSSVSGKLGGTTKTTKVFEVPGDTAQFFFRSDSSADGYFGYYAEVTDTSGVFTDWDPYTESPEDYTVVALAEAAKDGYEFDGWYTDPVGGTKVSIGDNMDLTSGSTVYAHWKASETVTVTFDSNGGSACDSMSRYKGQEIGALPVPVRANRIFVGWYPSPQPSRSLDANTRVTEDMIIDENVTLYARWNETHTLTFNGNGNSSTITRTVPDGETLNTLPGMKRTQYILEGWYPNADGSGEKLTTDTVITGDATYYAKWAPEMIDKASDDLAYSYSATWSNASNESMDNVDNNLDFHPTNNQRQTASLHIRFEMNEATDTVVPVGAVRITIPKNVFKGWNNQPVDTNNISYNLPLYPNKRNGMLFSYMEEDDAYVLINNTELAGGAGVDATFSYYVYPNQVPGGAMDYNGNYLDGYDYYHDTFPITFAVDSDLDGNNDTSDIVDLSLEMHTRVRSEQSKKCTSVYYTWNNSWGTKPADADDYFYIEWNVSEIIQSTTSQPYRYSISEDTVHDGTVIVLPPMSGEYGTIATQDISSNFSNSVVTKHHKSLLADLDENGKTFHNEAVVTEHWKSGYETTHLVKADTIVYGRRYPTGEWDKHYQGWSSGSNVRNGGQEDILDDNKEVSIPYELIYDGESNGQPVTWDEETRTYNAPERTIMMRDGDPGDLLYSSGRVRQKYVWQPITGNTALGDNDYYIKSLSIYVDEYDAQNNNGMWTERYLHSDKSLYDPTEIWVRLKGESDYIKFCDLPADSTSVTLPENTVGFEIRHKTSYYSTKISIQADMYLKPTRKVRNLVRNDVTLNATSIIKNRAICHIWNGDDEAHPFFEVTNYKTDTSSAFKDLWELNVSSTGLQTRKYTAPETSTVFDVEKGTQDTPVMIQGRNYNNSGRVKRLESGIFYDLLPMGTTVDESTLFGVIKTTNSSGSSSVSTASYNSMKSSAMDKNYYSVEFVDNWKGSGRTMMIINVGLPDTVKACGIDFYYMLHNTYENVIDRGTTVENDVAFVNTSENKTPYNMDKTYLINVIKEKECYEDIERKYGDDVAYAQAAAHYIPVDAFSWGFYKSVMTGSSFEAEGSTIPNNEYTYRLTYSQSEYSKSDKIVFFDVLEGGTETHPSQWYGVLKNVNTNAAAEMVSADNANVHCAPVVYYSTKDRSAFTGTDWDVSNRDTWSTEKPADAGSITAIAVDCSKGTNGSDFIMKGKTAMNIYVTMQAPNDAEKVGKSTTNEAVSWARKFVGDTPEGEPTDEYSDATVTIKDTGEELHKSSDTPTGTEAEPAGVIYGDVLTYTISYTNNDEDLTYRDVVLEDPIPEGLNIEQKKVSVYIDDPSNKVAISNSARASMEVSGQNLTFRLSEVLPDETVNIEIPTTVNVREGTFINQAKKISVNGYEKVIKSEKTYHAVIPATVKVSKKVFGTGAMLPGATLQLLNSSNAVVEEWVSTDQPKGFVLGADDYTIHEVTPPEGYAVASDIRFSVDRSGAVTCSTEGALDTSDNTISMFDKSTSVDVNISKTVTGSFGNKTKQFSFTANITGLTPTKTYKLKKGDTETSIAASPEGTAEAIFTLSHNQTASILKLPSGAKVTVTEAASDHIASYEASDGVGALCSGSNEASNAALSTEEMTLDVDRGAVSISYTNNQDSVVPTGIRAAKSAFAVFALILAGLLLLIRKKKFARE